LTGHASLDLALTGGTLSGALTVNSQLSSNNLVINGTDHYIFDAGSGSLSIRVGLSGTDTFYGFTNTGNFSNNGYLLSGGAVIGSPTGGQKGGGTLNAVTVYANGVALTSDANLKTDITPLAEALPVVAAIEPRSFRWIKPEPQIRQITGPDGEIIEVAPELPGPPDFFDRMNRGFLAQDVAKVLGGDNETVDLGGMVAVLWQAVRELSAQVEELSRA
jgi:hypothetical protein